MNWTYKLVAVCLVSILTACTHFAIEGDCPKTPDSIYGQETVHGSMYGFNWDDNSRQVRKAGNRLGLARVEYRTNALYTLLSIVTLGLYVPVDVDYWVEAPDRIEHPPKKHGGNQ
jgi:hypothetical protein